MSFKVPRGRGSVVCFFSFFEIVKYVKVALQLQEPRALVTVVKCCIPAVVRILLLLCVRVRKANAAWGKELAAIWYVCLNIGMPSMKKKLYNMEYDDEAVDLGRAPFLDEPLCRLRALSNTKLRKP